MSQEFDGIKSDGRTELGGYQVGDILKLKPHHNPGTIIAIAGAKKIVVVGFTKNNDAIIQIDDGRCYTTSNFPPTDQYEIIGRASDEKSKGRDPKIFMPEVFDWIEENHPAAYGRKVWNWDAYYRNDELVAVQMNYWDINELDRRFIESDDFNSDFKNDKKIRRINGSGIFYLIELLGSRKIKSVIDTDGEDWWLLPDVAITENHIKSDKKNAFSRLGLKEIDKTLKKKREEVSKTKQAVEQSNQRITEILERNNTIAERLEAIAAMRSGDVQDIFGQRFDQLWQIAKIKKVFVSSDGTINIFTDYIYSRPLRILRSKQVDLGEFQIEIMPPDRIRIYNLTRDINKCAHPHVYADHKPCFGNISDSIYKLLANRQYDILIPTLMQYLETLNETDFTNQILDWPTKE